MSKSHSSQKGQHMKNQSPYDVTAASSDHSSNLDSNQSTQSISSGDSEMAAANDRDQHGDSSAKEGAARDFGQPVDLQDGQSTGTRDQSHGSQSSQSAQRNGASKASASERKDSEGGIMAKAASLLDAQAVKKNLNLVKSKAQDLMASGKEQVSDRLSSVSDDVKLRGMMVDESIKANPYPYAIGAIGLGFILARAFSGKAKGDLDVLVSTVNKLNFATIAGMLGIKTDASVSTEQPNYNSDQARKIG